MIRYTENKDTHKRLRYTAEIADNWSNYELKAQPQPITTIYTLSVPKNVKLTYTIKSFSATFYLPYNFGLEIPEFQLQI